MFRTLTTLMLEHVYIFLMQVFHRISANIGYVKLIFG